MKISLANLRTISLNLSRSVWGKQKKTYLLIRGQNQWNNISTCSTLLQGKNDSAASSNYVPNSSLETSCVYNRNPRNLEKLRIGEKPAGWTLEKPGRCFWNKLTFEMSGKHVNAKIEHYSGQVPLVASSKEWCIRKFLYSTKDISAVRAVGRVLARRCIEMGISEVCTTYTAEDRKKEKVDVFLRTFEDAGIALTEPEQYQRPVYLNDDQLPEKGWEVYDEIIVKNFPTNLEK